MLSLSIITIQSSYSEDCADEQNSFLEYKCSDTRGDTIGYREPTEHKDMHSNEPGWLTQPGGVAAQIEAEQGNPSDNSFFTIRE
ncbi:hypothetical protein [Pseudofrancisella aestuarii]|uniref:hypothetical protein n=1 Tax=Pseudofrancisella aestuarii TaxID=2670347 RepID=UPI001FCE35C2|nr:hypothetical protein [Pseudofrancisella aestuarii]